MSEPKKKGGKGGRGGGSNFAIQLLEKQKCAFRMASLKNKFKNYVKKAIDAKSKHHLKNYTLPLENSL